MNRERAIGRRRGRDSEARELRTQRATSRPISSSSEFVIAQIQLEASKFSVEQVTVFKVCRHTYYSTLIMMSQVVGNDRLFNSSQVRESLARLSLAVPVHWQPEPRSHWQRAASLRSHRRTVTVRDGTNSQPNPGRGVSSLLSAADPERAGPARRGAIVTRIAQLGTPAPPGSPACKRLRIRVSAFPLQ